MSTNLLKHFFSSNEESTTNLPSHTQIDFEYKEFLPEVYDTWSFIHKLSAETTHFREIYDLYRYERSENQQKDYFNQLKMLDETIYKLSFTIHQRIQSLEKLVQPAFEDFRRSEGNSYTPASIRIAQNQLNSLKLSFKRIISKHNSDSIDYQNDLTQSLENSKAIMNSPSAMQKIQNLFNSETDQSQSSSILYQEQVQIQEQEKQIADLETRLESIRVLKERVRHMK